MARILNVLIIASLLGLWLSACSTKNTFLLRMTLEAEQETDQNESYYFDDAASIIRSRLNSFGINDEDLELKKDGNRIFLKITGVDTGDVEVIGKILTANNKIGFWETYENKDVLASLIDVNLKALEYHLGDEYPPFKKQLSGTDDTDIESLIRESDSTANEAMEKFIRENPFFALLRPMVNNEGDPLPSCLVGLASSEDTLKVRQLLNRPEITNLMPRDLKLMWSRDPYKYDKSGKYYELHAIKVTNILEEPVLDGRLIPYAEVKTDRGGYNIRIELIMNEEGAYRWKRVTGENLDKCIAVTIDNKVITYPRVMTQITSGKTEITGDYSLEEAQFLASVFSSGGLEMKVKLSLSDVLIEKPK